MNEATKQLLEDIVEMNQPTLLHRQELGLGRLLAKAGYIELTQAGWATATVRGCQFCKGEAE